MISDGPPTDTNGVAAADGCDGTDDCGCTFKVEDFCPKQSVSELGFYFISM